MTFFCLKTKKLSCSSLLESMKFSWKTSDTYRYRHVSSFSPFRSVLFTCLFESIAIVVWPYFIFRLFHQHLRSLSFSCGKSRFQHTVYRFRFSEEKNSRKPVSCGFSVKRQTHFNQQTKEKHIRNRSPSWSLYFPSLITDRQYTIFNTKFWSLHSFNKIKFSQVSQQSFASLTLFTSISNINLILFHVTLFETR